MPKPANLRELVLFVGDTSGFTMELFNDVDAEESLLAATRARFTVKSDVSSAATVILDLDTVVGGLVIDVNSNTIAATPTGAQADALVNGDFIGSLNVEFGAGNWKESDRLIVKVRRSVAVKLA